MEVYTMNNTQIIETARKALEDLKTRSAWDRGVKAYASDLIDTVEYWLTYNDELPAAFTEIKRIMLDGAANWNHYSWGGCSLCYDRQIAERLCTPSELKKTRNGQRKPNSHEEWLDTQARALGQACTIAGRVIIAAMG